jgi:hypothetical protein
MQHQKEATKPSEYITCNGRTKAYHIGGGNASKINFKLNDNMAIVTNQDGIDGSAGLWKQKAI